VTNLYLDSSAIVKLVIDEEGSAELRAAIADASLVTSRIAVVEVGKAIARVDPAADPHATLEAFAFVELDEELSWSAAGTGRAVLRALDAIHVASAVLLGEEISAFITYDGRQSDAATEVGLRVLSPGVELPRT